MRLRGVVPARRLPVGLLSASCSSSRRFPLAFLSPKDCSFEVGFRVWFAYGFNHVRSFHRGLSLHLQRAHDGHTPSDAENERVCHESCSEQHAPRQPLSYLTFNVRQKNAVDLHKHWRSGHDPKG